MDETGLVSQNAAIVSFRGFQQLIALVCRTVRSKHSKKAYRTALIDFFGWMSGTGVTEIDRGTVLAYRERMEAIGMSPSTVSLRLTAIRQLCKEAKLAGVIDQQTWEGIAVIPGPHREGRRTGNWLTAEQAAKLIDTRRTRSAARETGRYWPRSSAAGFAGLSCAA